MAQITIEQHGQVTLFTINRPQRKNAICKDTALELQAGFTEFDRSAQRVAVITGAGDDAFSAGADVGNLPELWRCIPGAGFSTDKPIIAATAGWVVGGAMVLTMMCDLLVAADNSKFSYPEARLGFTGGMIAGLAARLSSVPFATEPEEVFAELGRASAGGPADYSSITYARIRDEGGVFWGGERLFASSFAHPDGLARMYAVEHRGAAEQPCADFPLHLTTGRVLAQYQSGAQTRRVRALPDEGPFVELHPLVAGRIGVAHGDTVRISTRRGTMSAPARVVTTIRPDTLFVPIHWVGANRLTNDALDPVSKMPEFKVCAASVVAG
jgi:anaerobic selenocysteine-containing dehydrogenase